MAQKVLPGEETLLLVPAVEINGTVQLISDDGLVPFDAPTTALLNTWQPKLSPSVAGSSAGGNISQSVINDLNLAQSNSDTDDTKVITDYGSSETPTFYNFDAEIHTLQDADPTDGSSVYNLAKSLTRAPDVPYAIVHRVGKAYTDEFTVGDEVTLYYAWTDVPVWGIGDGNNISANQKFVPKSLINSAYVLEA